MTADRVCQYCGSSLESYPTGKVGFNWRCEREECRDRERREREQAQRALEKERLIRIQANPERYLREFHVPRKYLQCSLDNFEGGGNVVQWCREYAQDLVQSCAGNVLLTGGCGTGKTHLAVAILRQAICEGFSGKAIFTTAPELLLNIREAFSEKTTVTEREVVEKYSDVDLLLLDDLGAEKQSSWSITTLFLIIDRRLREMLPTVITSNLSLDGIESVLSKRLASRLSESRVIELKLPDYRKRRLVG